MTKVKSRNKHKKVTTIKELPETVVVKLDQSLSYDRILRDVRTRLSMSGLTEKVLSVRNTLGGSLYIQLKKKPIRTDDVRSVVKTSSGAKAKKVYRTAAVEIRDRAWTAA